MIVESVSVFGLHCVVLFGILSAAIVIEGVIRGAWFAEFMGSTLMASRIVSVQKRDAVKHLCGYTIPNA